MALTAKQKKLPKALQRAILAKQKGKARRRKEKRKEKAWWKKREVEDKYLWFNYFHSMKNVCPWSFKSYCNDRILITQFDKDILELNEQNWSLKQWDAIVYTTKLSVDELDKFCRKTKRITKKSVNIYGHILTTQKVEIDKHIVLL